MEGITFYRETFGGNVFAAFTANGTFVSRGHVMQEGVGALHDTPDSYVCGTSASVDFLKTKCTPIEEADARRVHPRLFAYLDSTP